MTCSYSMSPGYSSRGFSVITDVTARCGTSAQSANVADGQGPSATSDAEVSATPEIGTDADVASSPTDSGSQDASASNGGGRKMLL